MSVQLIEHLAKRLDLSDAEARAALSECIQEIKDQLETQQTATLPGLGTFRRSAGTVLFEPDETLSQSVNNRFGALETELVEVNVPSESGTESGISSETASKRNEKDIDQDILDQILSQDISEDLFRLSEDDASEQAMTDTASFDEELLTSNQDHTPFSSPITANDAPRSNGAVEAASMKEDDPNTNHSDPNSSDSDTEWSPFFEELEGEEFDIDTTIDLSADDWETEFPTPPSSPFSSFDDEPSDQDELYFDVDADPDDTLFSPASSMEADNAPQDTEAWAANPLDDSNELFDDSDELFDDQLPNEATQEYDTATYHFSAEDEFFSPVSSSASNADPDDTLFASDTIYSEEATTEADDTIFLAPEQTVQAPPSSPGATDNPYAPHKEREPVPAGDDKDPNPYVYRPETRKSGSSSWTWVAATALLLILGGGAGAYIMGWPPFNASDGPIINLPSFTSPSANDPVATTPDGGIAGGDNGGDNSLAENPSATDPSATSSVGLSPDSAANDPSAAPPVIPEPAPDEQPPVIQRIEIDRERGGWAIIVASETQRNEAERIADVFTQRFQDRGFPIGILLTNQYVTPRHRVAVGQFDTYNEARATLENNRSSVPDDAWLLEID